MPVLINWKICDNAKECNGIAVCKTGALTWDEKNKKIKIDNSKCISCGACEPSCKVGAIRVAKTEAEYAKIKKEMEKDPRNISDLFVDRYGGKSIHPAFLIHEDAFKVEVLESAKLTVVEFFSNDSIKCLLYSIPLKDLMEGMDVKYRKLELKNDALMKKYGVSKLPSLLFFNKGKLVGKIEGYFDIAKKKELREKIKEIASKGA
jgi:ferredoxin